MTWALHLQCPKQLQTAACRTCEDMIGVLQAPVVLSDEGRQPVCVRQQLCQHPLQWARDPAGNKKDPNT